MQIVLFLILILVILTLFISKNEALSARVKVYIFISLLAVMIAGWAFNAYSQKSAQHDRDVLTAFEQGKDVRCKEYIVNSKDFIYISGTLSFVSKGDNKNLRGVVIDLSTCKQTNK